LSGVEPPLPLALIVPTREADSALDQRLIRWRSALNPAEICVVQPTDPVATFGRPAAIAESNIRYVEATRGRGTQCNAGAAASTAPWLLFLHDDTELPVGARQMLVGQLVDDGLGMACFRLRFDREHPMLRLYAWCSRFDSVWTTFGDQGYLIRRSVFEAVGGFPNWPLFEDVELPRRVRRLPGSLGRIRKLPMSVVTSAVRFEHGGIVRQQLRNLIAMFRFFSGADPTRLAAAYERGRPYQRGPASRSPETGRIVNIPKSDRS
jgi:GT2 family glycosyltransferase